MAITQIAAVDEKNVLVVYNSESAESLEVKNYYLTKRPNVLAFDLSDDSILSPTIRYAEFAAKIRNPIRQHLDANGLEQTVEVITLTKGIPHRIKNIGPHAPNAGDAGASAVDAYDAGNASFASVDSELTLLQYDLDANESGGDHDSPADNAVLNPFFKTTSSFSSFSRSSIVDGDQVFSRTGNAENWWVLGTETIPGRNVSFTPSDPGDIYLTARLDAATVQDVKDLIDRAQNIAFRRDIDAIIFDSDGRADPLDRYIETATGFEVFDYAEAESLMSGNWTSVLREDTTTFIVGKAEDISYSAKQVVKGPIAHLHSYGVNHSGNNTQIRPYLTTFDGQLVPGAIFSAYESFGARGLGGLSNSNQGQVEEWFASGGTFATGPVWEPFTFGILKSEIFLDRFLNQGFTFVEAAWAGIPQISWQSVVIGDPLATANYRNPTAYEAWVFGNTGTTPDADPAASFDGDYDLDGLANGLEYAFGLNPNVEDSDSTNRPEFTGTSGDKTITFTLVDPVPPDLSIIAEMSSTLEPDSWTSIATRTSSGTWSGSATVVESTTASGIEVELTDNTTVSEDRGFYKISVSSP